MVVSFSGRAKGRRLAPSCKLHLMTIPCKSSELHNMHVWLPSVIRGVAPTASSALHTMSMESAGSTHITTGAMLFTIEISLHSGRSMFMEGIKEPFRGHLSRLDTSSSMSSMSSNDRLLLRSWCVPAPLALRNIMGERELAIEYAIVTLLAANQGFPRGFLPFMSLQANLRPLKLHGMCPPSLQHRSAITTLRHW